MKVIIELTTEQLDNLLSNRISEMKPVIDYIEHNVISKKAYLIGYGVLFIGREE